MLKEGRAKFPALFYTMRSPSMGISWSKYKDAFLRVGDWQVKTLHCQKTSGRF